MILHHQHLITGAELNTEELQHVLDLAITLKNDKSHLTQIMSGKHLGLLFEKPSLRTRFSFTVAMHQLGGHVLESTQATRKHEAPEDWIRVLQSYCDVVMIRTYNENIFERMMPWAKIPIINGLSDNYHPCQILADLMTLKEHYPSLAGRAVAYVGDGNNMLHSLLLMAPKLGIHVHYSCPQGAMPDANIVKQAQSACADGLITAYATAAQAVSGCDAVMTDVWTSMGFSEKNEVSFAGYQVNEQLMMHAKDNAIVMHCMPMDRGKEISATLPDQPSSVIFQQAQNRLHAQKALLCCLTS